jgi:glycosyltransferase involved in cell wall biosynthesis
MTHVLIVPTEHYLTVGSPLGGIFQHHQAIALRRAGFKVGVIGVGVVTPRFLFRSYPYPELDESHGFPVYRRYVRRLIPHRWWSISGAIALYTRLGLDLYERYVRENGHPDIVHAHNFRFAAFVADAIRESHGVPFVITEHNSKWRSGADRGTLDALKATAGHSRGITGVSHALAHWIERDLSLVEVGVLPNIVDSAFLDAPLERRHIVHGAPRFLSIGFLTDNKNHASAIRAFAARFADSGATLRIGGDGPERASLERLVATLQLGGQVTILGHLSRPQVVAEMQAANCLVLSSRYETFGVVLIEAMAMGLPVVSTRSQGPEDIVKESNGVLVAPDDSAALGDAMAHMAEHLADYPPERLRDECRAHYGPDAFVRRAGDLYSRALAHLSSP